MKYLLLSFFISIASLANGQKYRFLGWVNKTDTIPKDSAIIYGNFIQRLGFDSGGFPQDIRLINIDTKEVIAFRVKTTFKSAKENTFVCYLTPGNYAVLNYWWTQGKWYGSKTFTEPIFKESKPIDNNSENKSNVLPILDKYLEKFTFSIKENSLNYLGTWHFESKPIWFDNDKMSFDTKHEDGYQQIHLPITVLKGFLLQTFSSFLKGLNH